MSSIDKFIEHVITITLRDYNNEAAISKLRKQYETLEIKFSDEALLNDYRQQLLRATLNQVISQGVQQNLISLQEFITLSNLQIADLLRYVNLRYKTNEQNSV